MSKKGIIITAIILSVITAASFLIWLVPSQNPPILVVSDYKEYLDGVKKIQETLQETIEIEYQSMLDGKSSIDDYISVAEITSSQVTGLISEFVISKPTQEWQGSYIAYMEALKKFNSLITETQVVANMKKGGENNNDSLQKIETIKSEIQELIKRSDQSRPN